MPATGVHVHSDIDSCCDCFVSHQRFDLRYVPKGVGPNVNLNSSASNITS